MKSKIVLLKEKMEKERAKFQGYVKTMEEAIKKNYPNGYEFDLESPFADRFLYYGDVDDDKSYYTGLADIYVKAIEETKSFKKIANAIKKKGCKYEFKTSVSHPYSRAEWKIYLHITEDKDYKEVQKYVKIMDEAIQRKYPNGLDFDEIPHIERFMWYREVDIDRYYTGIEKIFAKAIKETKSFKKIAKELTNNGYEFELKGTASYSWNTPEWQVNLIIK